MHDVAAAGRAAAGAGHGNHRRHHGVTGNGPARNNTTRSDGVDVGDLLAVVARADFGAAFGAGSGIPGLNPTSGVQGGVGTPSLMVNGKLMLNNPSLSSILLELHNSKG